MVLDHNCLELPSLYFNGQSYPTCPTHTYKSQYALYVVCCNWMFRSMYENCNQMAINQLYFFYTTMDFQKHLWHYWSTQNGKSVFLVIVILYREAGNSYSTQNLRLKVLSILRDCFFWKIEMCVKLSTLSRHLKQQCNASSNSFFFKKHCTALHPCGSAGVSMANRQAQYV